MLALGKRQMSKQDKYEEFLKHLPATASDRTLMALKGHLLVEQAIREFVYARVAKPERLKDKQIPFATILDFAYSLHEGDNMNWVWESAKKPNRLRNLLAHNLSPSKIEELEIDFISYVRHNDGELEVLVDNKQIIYEELALAIFQIYDIIISAPHYPTSERITEHHINTAINKAFLSVGGVSTPPPSRGPTSRKRWPRN